MADRLEQWRLDVEGLRVEALELQQLHDEALTPVAQQQFARLWADLAGRSFDLLWSALTPELIAATAEASLVAGFPVFGRPGQVMPEQQPRPSYKERKRLKAEQEQAQETEVLEELEEAAPLQPEPEPIPEPPARMQEGDGWITTAELAALLNCSLASITKYKREKLFEGLWRLPLPGEGKGQRFDPEACRQALANRPDQRLRKRAKPKPPKPLRVSADALAADPALLAQLEALLACVKGES